MRSFWASRRRNYWFLVPLFVLVLFWTLAGIYAAAVLPNDSRALIVFGLLFTVAQIVSSASWYDVSGS
jgi:hypothetical protein